MEFYRKTITDIYSELKTSEKGISGEDAKDRLDKYGYNRIKEKKKTSPFVLFLGEFNDPVIWVLLGALIISSITGYYEYNAGKISLIEFVTEPIVIGSIVIINAIIGFFQEYKAEKAIEALKKMASFKAIALRDNKEVQIDATELVPGDIILLSAGEKIPADARLFDLHSFYTQEAILTGESLPVKKELATFEKNLQTADRKNMVFSGTIITDGKAKAIVVSTGMDTEIGKIAKLIDSAEDEQTPLQQKIEKLGKFLTYLTLGICIFIFLVLFIREGHPMTALITSVSLAVAAIPEGLPAVVTIALAFGIQRMVKKNALIRKLPSVETLGSTTVICSDKTGTLTKNEMTVKKIYVDNTIIEVTGSGYEPTGAFSKNTKGMELLLKTGILNNDAKLTEADGSYSIIGDPTEGALIVSGIKAGLNHESLEEESPRIDEILFDSKRKRMTTVHKAGNKRISYVKGAPDIILDLCDRIMIDGKVIKLDQKERKKIMSVNEEFSGHALRVLGFAYKELSAKETGDDYETKLIFIGLQGMIDPPREEVKEAILRCKTAGIRVIMITGDHVGTATAIAKELGITGKAVTGHELETIDLDREVENIGIYARVDPEHKMRIVKALKKKGHIVAMTGDGVNDAPALKASDIGISMGITGTDVAKEASDMILLDDNFTTIVNAVEEGRGVYDNIKKFVQYLLSCNFGEILVIFIATMLGLPLPLLPIQILWMNLVTDGLPAIALGVDPTSKDIMKRKPRNPKEGIITKAFLVKIGYTGILIASATLLVFWYGLKVINLGEVHARTLAFSTLVLLQFVGLYIIRSEYKLGFFSNKKLVLAIAVSFLLQMAVIYTGLSKLFQTRMLDFTDWVFIASVSGALIILTIIINQVLKAAKLIAE